MSVNYEPKHLSASTKGKAILLDFSSNFTTIHTAPSGTNVYDEVYLNLYYFGTSATGIAEVRLDSLQPGEVMQFHVVSGTVTPILRGHRISDGASIYIRNATGGTMLCFGTVNRITII